MRAKQTSRPTMSKYLYLDDAEVHQLEPFTEPINRLENSLSISLRKPKKFDAQVEDLRTFPQDFDGLILDLLLHQMPNEQGEKANYRGTTLAQHLRTLGTEGTLKEFPIVLWSDADKLAAAYNSDASAHDLFDMTYKKEELVDQGSTIRVVGQLESLVTGYTNIKRIRANNERLHKFLGLESAETLDPRIDEFFGTQVKRPPVHEYARFILKALLLIPGALIEESFLAARLGVDAEASDDWEELKKLLAPREYKGVFKKGWPRWWAADIEVWWRSLAEDMPILRSALASERVRLLKEKTGLQALSPARPVGESYSTAYWTVCQATQKPLDPRDGLIVDKPYAKLWQDKLYVSLEAELDGERKLKGLKLDPLDKGRLPRLKARLERREVKLS